MNCRASKLAKKWKCQKITNFAFESSYSYRFAYFSEQVNAQTNITNIFIAIYNNVPFKLFPFAIYHTLSMNNTSFPFNKRMIKHETVFNAMAKISFLSRWAKSKAICKLHYPRDEHLRGNRKNVFHSWDRGTWYSEHKLFEILSKYEDLREPLFEQRRGNKNQYSVVEDDKQKKIITRGWTRIPKQRW